MRAPKTSHYRRHTPSCTHAHTGTCTSRSSRGRRGQTHTWVVHGLRLRRWRPPARAAHAHTHAYTYTHIVKGEGREEATCRPLFKTVTPGPAAVYVRGFALSPPPPLCRRGQPRLTGTYTRGDGVLPRLRRRFCTLLRMPPAMRCVLIRRLRPGTAPRPRVCPLGLWHAKHVQCGRPGEAPPPFPSPPFSRDSRLRCRRPVPCPPSPFPVPLPPFPAIYTFLCTAVCPPLPFLCVPLRSAHPLQVSPV